MSKITTYTVREPGCSAWAGPGLAEDEARTELARARRAGLRRAIIVEDVDEIGCGTCGAREANVHSALTE